MSMTTGSGDRLEGLVKVLRPPINFSATVENCDNAFVIVEIEQGRGRCRPAIWVSLYGQAAERGDALQESLRELFAKAFG